jgi:hypothetical protein
MRIVEYDSFAKHSHRYTVGDVSALPPRKRFKFYYRIMQTFAIIRLNPDPRFKAFLDDPRVRQTIVTEARRWITEPWYRGRHCVNDRMPWFKQFIELRLGAMNPFGETWECRDHHLWYLLENISCEQGIMADISYTLETIPHGGKYRGIFCPSCIVETTDEVYVRMEITRGTRVQRQNWLKNVSAPAIARNAFELGWELRMLSIVRDFAVEVVMRKPRCYTMMHAFLKSVEDNILAEQQKEEDFNVAAAVALQRAGIDSEICRMIMPGKTRYMGIPLAMMPPYLKLV